MVRLLLAAWLLALFSAAPALGQTDPYAYDNPSFNEGLTASARPVNRETPQALLESFLDAAEMKNWQRAAHALDLSSLPPADQRRLGPELARQMHMVIDRAIVLDWAALSDRPDAVDTASSSKNPMAGEPRRNIRLALLDIPGRTVSIRLARIKPGQGDPVWVFSRQTTENIPMMYARFAPKAFERALPASLQKQAFWTLAWWEVAAIPLIFAGAVLAGGAVYRAAGYLSRRERLKLVSGILESVKFPAGLLAFAATFALVQSAVFTFSGAVNAFIEPLQIGTIVLALTALVVSMLDAVINHVALDSEKDITAPDAEHQRNFYTTLSAVRRFVLVLFLLLGIAFILIQTNLAQTLGFSLLASAGVMGLVFAFAARELLANIMASMQIAFAKTARIGDAVLFKDVWCYVEKIGFTHLRLRTWDGRRLIAPVTQVVEETFENWTKQDPALSKYIMLTFDHRADVEALRQVFLEWVDQQDEILCKDEAKVQVVDHTAAGMVVRFLFVAPDPSTGWSLQCACRETILRAAASRDGAAVRADEPAFLPREREVQLASASE